MANAKTNVIFRRIKKVFAFQFLVSGVNCSLLVVAKNRNFRAPGLKPVLKHAYFAGLKARASTEKQRKRIMDETRCNNEQRTTRN